VFRSWHGVAVACGLLASLTAAHGQRIYTCVDSTGRRITSDRPIAECTDRAQQELNASGTVRRTIAPSLTAQERAAAEERAKRADEERLRAEETRRRHRALLNRYRTPADHQQERAAALAAVDDVIAAAHRRTQELQGQQKKLATESEFYQANPSRMPAALRRQIEEAQQQLAGQQRFIADKEDEKKRINARFDEELATLRQLWAQRDGVQGATR